MLPVSGALQLQASDASGYAPMTSASCTTGVPGGTGGTLAEKGGDLRVLPVRQPRAAHPLGLGVVAGHPQIPQSSRSRLALQILNDRQCLPSSWTFVELPLRNGFCRLREVLAKVQQLAAELFEPCTWSL
jgi:hypothetical protein